ncbi:MAG: RDD family protein [Deltaproteobacteria bacterium]|nr:RDD family protein [Deltaproteobacteria bacterium]
MCAKCKRPLEDQGVGWLSSPVSKPPAETAERDQPDAGSAREVERALSEALEKEHRGDLRGAFLACQAVLLERPPDLPESLLAALYLAMGRVSTAQGKPERARKYLQGVLEIQPTEPEALRLLAELEPEEASAETPQPMGAAAEAGGATRSMSASGRLVWTAMFWMRAAAMLIDVLLVIGLLAIMLLLSALILDRSSAELLAALGASLAHMSILLVVFGLLLLVYLTVFVRYGGQTVGKMVLGLRVVRYDGHSVGSAHAVLRALGMVLAALPGLAGFVWAAFDLNRRGWHDKIAGTLVVRLKPPRRALIAEPGRAALEAR